MAERADSRESQDDTDQVSGRQGKSCQPCKKKDKVQAAALFCKDCNQYQCIECIKVHEVFDYMSGHDIVKAEEALTLKPVFDMKGLDKCKDHRETLKFYCIDEQKLCCHTCTITRHRGCMDVQEIAAEAEKHPLNITDMESTIRELQETAKNVAKLLKITKMSTSGKLEAVLDFIDGMKKSLLVKFDQLKLAVTEQFQSAKEQLIQQVNADMTTTDDISNDLREKKDVLVSLKALGTPEQQFIACNIIQDQIMPFKKTFDAQRASLYNLDCSIECSRQLTELLESKFSLAAFSVDKVQYDSSASPKDKAVQLKLVTSVNLKQGEQDRNEPMYTGMDFFPDGRLAAVDNKNWKLYIMNESLERKGMFKFSDYRHDVCVVSEVEVAVTSEGCYLIEFLHVSKTNDITLTRTVRTTAKYYSICLLNETTFLVRTIDDKRPLRMITLTGEEKNFDNPPEKQYKFGGSASTYIRNKDIAVLTDRFEHTIYMYEIGQKGLPRRVVKHDDIKQPRGVCVGPDDCLFVCSAHTHSIVQVSPSGKLVATNKLDMWYPCTVCVSKDGRRMAVSNSAIGNRKLQLFYINI